VIVAAISRAYDESAGYTVAVFLAVVAVVMLFVKSGGDS
jgi:ABC-type sulfate transport system permease subunit